MDKIQLTVLGLSASPASNNAYALILKEIDGKRRLPIMIGAFEAQSIALEMEGVIPPRPMTHDLIRNLLENLHINLTEIFINDLVDGTFFAKLIFDEAGIDIDCRPSDAIAIAIRCGVPIYVNSEILEETSVTMQPEENINAQDSDEEEEDLNFIKKQSEEQKKPKTKLEKLQSELDKAISDENYEKAANLRDELKRFLERS